MRTEILKVTGMSCGSCGTKIADALEAIAGVRKVKVSLATDEVTVQYDERQTSPDQFQSAVDAAGFDVVMTTAPPRRPAKAACCG